jgi:hypothetical protein
LPPNNRVNLSIRAVTVRACARPRQPIPQLIADVGRRERERHFLILPKNASAKLPTRGPTSVEGTINDHPFKATLEPDGQGRQLEPKVPADLRRALAAAPKARASWSDITPNARRDWIQWITSARQAETRARRVHSACDMLASGKRRVCCFDRSGIYSEALGAPKAAE